MTLVMVLAVKLGPRHVYELVEEPGGLGGCRVRSQEGTKRFGRRVFHLEGHGDANAEVNKLHRPNPLKGVPSCLLGSQIWGAVELFWKV